LKNRRNLAVIRNPVLKGSLSKGMLPAMVRRAFGFLVLLSLLAGPVFGAGGEEGLDRAALERQILTGLAKRQDVAAQLDCNP